MLYPSYIFRNSPRLKETKELVISTNHISPIKIALEYACTHRRKPCLMFNMEKEKYKRKNVNDKGQKQMTQVSRKAS